MGKSDEDEYDDDDDNEGSHVSNHRHFDSADFRAESWTELGKQNKDAASDRHWVVLLPNGNVRMAWDVYEVGPPDVVDECRVCVCSCLHRVQCQVIRCLVHHEMTQDHGTSYGYYHNSLLHFLLTNPRRFIVMPSLRAADVRATLHRLLYPVPSGVR